MNADMAVTTLPYASETVPFSFSLKIPLYPLTAQKGLGLIFGSTTFVTFVLFLIFEIVDS